MSKDADQWQAARVRRASGIDKESNRRRLALAASILAIAGCSSHAVRCDGELQAINSPRGGAAPTGETQGAAPKTERQP